MEFNGFWFDGEVLLCERKGSYTTPTSLFPTSMKRAFGAILDMSSICRGSYTRRTAEVRLKQR